MTHARAGNPVAWFSRAAASASVDGSDVPFRFRFWEGELLGTVSLAANTASTRLFILGKSSPARIDVSGVNTRQVLFETSPRLEYYCINSNLT